MDCLMHCFLIVDLRRMAQLYFLSKVPKTRPKQLVKNLATNLFKNLDNNPGMPTMYQKYRENYGGDTRYDSLE